MAVDRYERVYAQGAAKGYRVWRREEQHPDKPYIVNLAGHHHVSGWMTLDEVEAWIDAADQGPEDIEDAFLDPDDD